MNKNFSIIVAVDENYGIGKNNDLLWNIPEDLKRFKKITTGHTIIMGRNTFLSLPNGALPNRRNIVISDCKKDNFPNTETVYSIEEAIDIADKYAENFIIGGGMIYKEFLPLSNKIYLTKVHDTFDADVFFPEINFDEWNIIEEIKNDSYSYITLTKKSTKDYIVVYLNETDGDIITKQLNKLELLQFSRKKDYSDYVVIKGDIIKNTNQKW